ncbi:CDP-alcohol phosphatidyltransferase family protein [Candidatus Bathyarchaeota archaeon]|nr:CDP-alcohol phosphatidyltransferase family protein [Candidatus Bathyarchaeota archaeon]
MVSSKFKKQFENIAKKTVSPMAKLGISPNHITVAGLLVAIIAAGFFAGWNGKPQYLIYAGVMIIISGLLDAIDGVLARSTGKVTRFGGFFDSVLDRYSDILFMSGVIIGGLCNITAGLLALAGSLMVSYTRSRAEMEGIKMAGVGFFERAERITFLAIVSIVAYWWLPALYYGVIILALLSHITLIQRVMYFKKMVERN